MSNERGVGILGDLHDAVWVAWGCYRGCPDCTIARGSGWVALSILRGLESMAWRICCGLPCQMGCHCLIFIWIIFNNFILIYLNSRVIHAYQCTNPVDPPRRTGGRPASVRCYKNRDNCGPVVVCCGTPTGVWKQMMKYCELHWLHGISGVTSCWWCCLRSRQISLSRHLHTHTDTHTLSMTLVIIL